MFLNETLPTPLVEIYQKHFNIKAIPTWHFSPRLIDSLWKAIRLQTITPKWESKVWNCLLKLTQTMTSYDINKWYHFSFSQTLSKADFCSVKYVPVTWPSHLLSSFVRGQFSTSYHTWKLRYQGCPTYPLPTTLKMIHTLSNRKHLKNWKEGQLPHYMGGTTVID